MKRLIAIAVLAASCALVAGPASARHVHHHYKHHHHGYKHHRYLHVRRDPYDPGFRTQVIGRTRNGDPILSGGIGFHRSDFGVMVPDSDGPNFIQSGF
jgi:hypothetical protein